MGPLLLCRRSQRENPYIFLVDFRYTPIVQMTTRDCRIRGVFTSLSTDSRHGSRQGVIGVPS